MKTRAIAKATLLSLSIGLIGVTSINGCSAPIAGESDEHEDYQSSVDLAPDFDAEDSLRKPTLVGSLESDQSVSAQFSAEKQFIAFSVDAEASVSYRFRLQAALGRMDGSGQGYRIALYRQAANGSLRGKALAVGSSSDGGVSVELIFESKARETLLLVAYRLSRGSSRGAFVLELDAQDSYDGPNELGDICGNGEDDNGNGLVDEGCTRECGPHLAHACGFNEYCRFEASALCGANFGVGLCEPRPDVCLRSFQPVCGCDGENYGNACSAAAAGTSVAHEGLCARTQS